MKSLSREQAQNTKAIKNPPPPIGHYHPKFSEIDCKVHHSNIHYHIKSQTSRKEKENLGDFEWEKHHVPDKLPKKILGKISFKT